MCHWETLQERGLSFPPSLPPLQALVLHMDAKDPLTWEPHRATDAAVLALDLIREKLFWR